MWIMKRHNFGTLITMRTIFIRWKKRVLKRLKKKLTDVRLQLNTKFHMWLKSKWNDKYIHDKYVNNIAEWNLLHDIINPPKRTKILNIHYSTILHGFMNTKNFRKKFKNFGILFDSGCRSTIVMGRLFEKLKLENDYVV